MKPLALFPICIALAAQPPLPPDKTPKDVRNFILSLADALTNQDTSGFLNHFDETVPGYSMLDYYAQALGAADNVISTIEIVSDKGDEADRTMQLDWILTVDSDRSQRQIVKISIHKSRGHWKVTALDPIGFFKPPSS